MAMQHARGSGFWALARCVFLFCLVLALEVHAQASRNLAPGFVARPEASRLVIVPADIELFSMSGGGVLEPRADWTAAAERHFQAALEAHQALRGGSMVRLDEKDLDELSEVNALHGAVAQSVFLHHMMGIMRLPTKNDSLDWSMGEGVQLLREKTGADYALFTWVRDSYASAERKAAMVAMAIFGVGLVGGSQIGYASLVDLKTGRVVWFNDLRRASGDLREAGNAAETVEALLRSFPPAR
jgi:hypothetical protein